MLGRIVAIWEGWAAYLMLPILTLLVGTDVALRYLFNLPFRWGSDVMELMLLLIVTAGLPATSLQNQHIRMALLDDRLPARAKRISAVARHLLTAFAAVVVGYAVLNQALDMYRYGDRAEMINIPFWPMAMLVTIAFVLSVLAELARAVSAARGRS
ncbi:TRAP transporter small permease [Chelativorans sp. Marseille-P2723]|uniref:TRAP transporter small permease n=1 Tax=Chelativorans sp. Marseille-P2723 TaxID=2709133 RepID=UPI00156E57FF|nr:TRAP transporter small permease [Chelativorans sp. Marseille-P2723]